MLKIEKLSNKSAVIRLKDRVGLFDRPFKQALFYSILFHVIVFGVFRIEFLHIPEAQELYNPVEVHLENEDTEAIVQDDIEEKIHFAPYIKEHLQLAQSYHQKDEQAMSSSSYFTNPNLEKTLLSERLDLSRHHYPLRLEFTSGLSKLKLIEDGSTLFRMKKESFKRKPLPQNFFTIAYNVKVSGETGKITRWKRKRELLDKRLQACADKIIEKIQFAPFYEPLLSGKVWIIFEVSGDEIYEYL